MMNPVQDQPGTPFGNPDGYRYSRFCELYQRWRRKQDVVLRQEHKAGEKLFVDWAGTTIPIHDPRGGPMQQAHLFVAVLGASSYTYAEATLDKGRSRCLADECCGP
jgi:transposase